MTGSLSVSVGRDGAYFKPFSCTFRSCVMGVHLHERVLRACARSARGSAFIPSVLVTPVFMSRRPVQLRGRGRSSGRAGPFLCLWPYCPSPTHLRRDLTARGVSVSEWRRLRVGPRSGEEVCCRRPCACISGAGSRAPSHARPRRRAAACLSAWRGEERRGEWLRPFAWMATASGCQGRQGRPRVSLVQCIVGESG